MYIYNIYVFTYDAYFWGLLKRITRIYFGLLGAPGYLFGKGSSTLLAGSSAALSSDLCDSTLDARGT